MIIDVDIGNSRIKWRYAGVPDSFGLFDLSDPLPEGWKNLPPQSRVRISSVIGAERTREFSSRLAALENVVVEIASVKNPYAGVNLAYADIATFGIDRWLALLAAKARFPAADCVVVQGGTALVADLLRADGRHLGGFIAAGWKTSLRSLGDAAHALSVADTVSDLRRSQPGATTLECIEAGTSLLFRGFLCELNSVASAQLTSPVWIFAGGDAELLLSLMSAARFGSAASSGCYELARDLVLEGLSIALP